MAMKIIPSALGATEEELRVKLNKISVLSREIHIDYGDGLLVDSKTVGWQDMLDLPALYPDNEFELHIMAQNPLPIAFSAVRAKIENIVLAVEGLDGARLDELEELSEQVNLFLALSPPTDAKTLQPYLGFIHGVTIMTVVPGRQGRQFAAIALDKIKKIQDIGFNGTFEVDGGINLDTIEQAVLAGASRLVVGSALTRAEDARKVYNELMDKIGNL